MAGPEITRKLAIIVHADVVGSTALVQRNETLAHQRINDAFQHFSFIIQGYGGAVHEVRGDALVAEFSRPSDAVCAALKFQQLNSERNADLSDQIVPVVRIGIALGEEVFAHDTVTGAGVVMAQRVEQLSEPGGICVTGAIHEAIPNWMPFDQENLGERELKGFEEPVRVYRVALKSGETVPEAEAGTASRSSFKELYLITSFAAVLLLAASGVIFFLKPFLTEEAPASTTNAALPLPDKPSIAVLPFANVNNDSEQDYFADGITDDLITDLSKISGLFVIARNSVFAYKGTAVNVTEVGRELGVQYVLEGSIRRMGDRIRINAQLIEASTGHHLWAERYDRDNQSIFEVQDEVIAQVVSTIAVKLTDTELTRIERPPTDNLEAYDYYLRAEQRLYVSDMDAFQQTLSFYEKAIALDSDFADAYAGLARAAVEIWRLDFTALLASAVARKRAYEAAARALSLDSNNARAYSVLAVLQVVDGHHDAAMESARKAVSASPSDAEAHLNLGLVLAYSGRPTEARAAVESALRLNPKPAPGALLLAGVGLFADGQFERAARAIESARDARPIDETARVYLASAYAHLGRIDEARAEIKALFKTLPMANLAYYRARDAYFKRAEDLATYIDGLRKAGMPEWPFGFRGDEENRLEESALESVTIGRTWMGRHQSGVRFVQQIGPSGVIVYRSEISFLTGKVELRSDKICQQFEAIMLDRVLCGYVYRNPTGSRENNDEYVNVMPDSLKYFSVVQ